MPDTTTSIDKKFVSKISVMTMQFPKLGNYFATKI